MADKGDERASLVNRILPEMVLSDGSPSSMTPPTPSFPADMSAQQRAMNRFAIEGNAVITGGAGTLALEASRALLEHGLSGLALLDVNPAQAESNISQLAAEFPSSTIVAIKANVTSESSVYQAMDQAAEQLGSINILCCFAGVVDCTHAIDMPADSFRRTLDINTTGEFICAQAAARHMVAQESGGSIVLVASISAHRVNFPQPQVGYNTAKCALGMLAQSLAAEWARYGIRVNSLSPGYMDTILNAGEGIAKARKIWCERNPTGRMGTPAELTGPLVLLCSKYAGAFITGTDLIVDGGATVF